jgi:hypothetical protein
VPDQTVPDVQLQSQTPLSSLTAINVSYLVFPSKIKLIRSLKIRYLLLQLAYKLVYQCEGIEGLK